MTRISNKHIVHLTLFRGIGIGLQILMQFAIARVAGPAGIGLVQVYQTWTCVLGETSAAGLPTEAMKVVSRDNHPDRVMARLTRSLKSILMLWVPFAALVLLAGQIDAHWMPFSLSGQLALILSILCFAVLRLCAETLKALGSSIKAIFAENLILPGLMTLLCLTLLLSGQGFANAEQLIYVASLFLVISSLYSLVVSLIKVRQAKIKQAQSKQTQTEDIGSNPSKARNQQDAIFSSETPFFWGTAVLSIGFLNLPFVLMPWFAEMEEVGLFALAFKCINPISTILIMLGAVFGPRFAQAKGPEETRRLLVRSQLISVAMYLPMLLPMLLFAEPLLGLFGQEFVAAKSYLLILAAAQLINAVTGLSGYLLNMQGFGKVEFQGAVLFCTFALLAGMAAGQAYGAYGVAVTYSAALAGKNLWSYAFALFATADLTKQLGLTASKCG